MPTLDWIGKKAVINHHNEVPFYLLKEAPDLSVGETGNGNLLVEGDNLLALKALLPHYAGQVKCIYIDPPYNTGNEGWIYNDNVNSPEIRKWLGKVVGGETEDLSRHDKWLCMIYPRLRLLKEFLKEDGVIFVSADENEHRYLALLMDEIFGPENHIETLIWKKSYGGGSKSKHIVNLHEYIVCFAKRIEEIPAIELPPSEKVLKYYKFTDSKLTIRGPYRLQPLATTSMDERPNLRYPIVWKDEEIWPEKQWQWSRERTMKALEEDDLVIRKHRGKWTVSYKQYLKDTEGQERSSKAYSIIEGIYTQQGTNEIKEMFSDGKAFSFPKPSGLIRHLLQIATAEDSLVLDSFAGSGTTGDAVLQLNKQDRGNRRFILVEMESNICRNVTAERLRRVCNGYENSEGNRVEGLGGGFRYCKLGTACFDEYGRINTEVTFVDLARHVFFSETGEPLPKQEEVDNPLIGTYKDIAVYLLYNGILKDKQVEGGNVLTQAVLNRLPKHNGPKVIYGTACRFSSARLKRENIVFKQIPYEIRVR
jgi:adenine specific DNA methylase Mod